MIYCGRFPMSKMYLIAKLALTILGVYVLVQFFNNLYILLRMCLRAQPSAGYAEAIVAFVIGCSFPCIFAYYLLFKSDKLAKKIVGSGYENGGAVDNIWIVAGFRAVFFLCGALIISGSINFIINAVAFAIYCPKIIVDMIVYKYIDEVFSMPFETWLRLFVRSCKAALGIYLLLGAPRFLRRQIKKIDMNLRGLNIKPQTQ